MEALFGTEGAMGEKLTEPVSRLLCQVESLMVKSMGYGMNHPVLDPGSDTFYLYGLAKFCKLSENQFPSFLKWRG